MRPVTRRYEDPLDRIWTTAARRVGLTLTRSAEVFAATDGRGALTLGEADTLDPDDCLAQMVLHELCHALVEGPESLDRPDWGLENVDDRDASREHACLRLQRWLASEYGLEDVLAPTTEHRAFYDGLGPHPLDPSTTKGSGLEAARGALRWVDRDPFGPHLREALEATAQVVRAAAPFARPPSLHAALAEPPPRHPSGLRAGGAGGTCGDCAWMEPAGPGPKVPRCKQARGRVELDWPACARFEAGPLDCRACGACCREAFHAVELGAAAASKLAPELTEVADGRRRLRRVPQPPRRGTRCVALVGGDDGAPFACTVYDDRPTPCREFRNGGKHCLEARRRVGLSL